MARHVDAEVDSPHHWVEPDSERSRRWALGAAIIAIGVVLVVLGWMVVSNLGPQRGESVVSTPPPPTTSKSPPKSNRPSEAEPKSTGAVASGLSPKSQAESNTSSEIASNAGPLMSDAEKPASPAPLIKTQSVPKGDSQPSAKSRPDPPAPVPIPFAGREAGEIRDDNSLKTKLVWCPPGSFRMGSPKNEPDRSSDEDQVDVTLKSGVWLGQCEVTQAEWQAVMGTTIRDQAEKGTIVKTLVGEGPNYPMYYVSHDEAREFCRKLSDRERAAGRLPAGCEYRLPTEAEWEYGCRAGTMTATAFGAKLSSRQANFDGDSPYNGAEKGPDLSKTQEVGRYPSNPWKLHDMHGNVWEWCLDAYKTELPGGVDPFASGAGSVEDRVSRGGGWGSGGGLCRSAYRYGFTSDYRVNYLGFRLSLGPSRN